MKRLLLLALAAWLPAGTATAEQRREYLKKLRAILPETHQQQILDWMHVTLK